MKTPSQTHIRFGALDNRAISTAATSSLLSGRFEVPRSRVAGKIVTTTRDCVGINRLWIQIGSEDKPDGAPRGMKSTAAIPSPILGESFKDYCESRTRKLIEAIQPEVLVLVGAEAQTLYQRAPEPEGIAVVNARHPAYGGEQKMANCIRPYL